MQKINTGELQSIQISLPPGNLPPFNVIEIIVTGDRHHITDVATVDALINDLIAARNQMWPYPPFEAQP
jgi:hypothetical protein